MIIFFLNLRVLILCPILMALCFYFVDAALAFFCLRILIMVSLTFSSAFCAVSDSPSPFLTFLTLVHFMSGDP